MKLAASLSLVLALLTAQAPQTPKSSQQPIWQREEKVDPLRKLSYSQFTLAGTYLIPPKEPTAVPPTLVVRCDANHKANAREHGKFLSGYLAVAAVLDFHGGQVSVEFRLDDGKLANAHWANSTDGGGAFFSFVEFDNLLYGHLLPHKENTTPPVRKVMLGVPEYLGSEVEVAFDMPDPSDVADACGVMVHKK